VARQLVSAAGGCGTGQPGQHGQNPDDLRHLVKRSVNVSAMRETGTQRALVTDGGGVVGVVTLADLLARLFFHHRQHCLSDPRGPMR
jgi:hypothetical protein